MRPQRSNSPVRCSSSAAPHFVIHYRETGPSSATVAGSRCNCVQYASERQERRSCSWPGYTVSLAARACSLDRRGSGEGSHTAPSKCKVQAEYSEVVRKLRTQSAGGLEGRRTHAYPKVVSGTEAFCSWVLSSLTTHRRGAEGVPFASGSSARACSCALPLPLARTVQSGRLGAARMTRPPRTRVWRLLVNPRPPSGAHPADRPEAQRRIIVCGSPHAHAGRGLHPFGKSLPRRFLPPTLRKIAASKGDRSAGTFKALYAHWRDRDTHWAISAIAYRASETLVHRHSANACRHAAAAQP